MVRRGLGLVLVVVLALASAGAALYAGFHFDNLIASERASIDALNRSVYGAQLSLANLRGAQTAYFAAGQSPDFWQKRGTDLAAELEQTIGSLQSSSISTAAKAHYESAVAALGNLNSLDQKARAELDAAETHAAAELIFSEATTGTETLSSSLSAAQSEELIARESRVGTLRKQQLQIGAAGIGGVLLMTLVLAFSGRKESGSSESASMSIAPSEPMPAHERNEAPRATVVAPPPVPAPVKEPTPAAAPVQAAPEPPRVDLANAAQICVDFARVVDGKDIPPLLERAARVLDAKGLVLWMVDGSGASLRPSLAHGYPEKVLQKLGPLQVDADNVTSLAFRSMQVQTLSNTVGTGSAFAVPVVTANGCIGVLSAEVAHGTAPADALPVSRMFAAQLATLVSPAEPAASARSANA